MKNESNEELKYRIDSNELATKEQHLDDELATKDLVQFFDSELNSLLNQAKLHSSLDNATLYGALLLVLTDNLIESVGRSSTKELLNIAQQVVESAQE